MARIACVVVFLAACGEQAVEYPGPPELALGFGQTELVPIQSGDPVPIADAPQGGNIVWAAASVRYLDPAQLEMIFSITSPTGARTASRALVDLDAADGGFAPTATLAHMLFMPDEHQFSGLPCVLRLEARDREGRSAIDEKTIVPTRY